MTTPIDIDTLTDEQFKALPLVIRGESKEVRYAGNGLVVIKYLPTVYSFTHNRCDVVEGSDVVRLKAMRTFLALLQERGVPHAYLAVNDRWVLSRFVVPHEVEYAKYGCEPFTPSDLDAEAFKALPRAPPIEVIVKSFHMGTSKHRYHGMSGTRVRASHPQFANFTIKADGAYPTPIVRFDWRNPLHVGERRVADEILPPDIADFYIDIASAERTARQAFATLQDFLAPRDIIVCDLCLFVDEAGTMLYGEITPDCGRFRHFELGSLDKDVWRAGGSSAQVIEKWLTLAEMIARQVPDQRFLVSSLHAHAQGAPMEFTVGTTNPYKVREIAAILRPTGCELRPYDETDPDETETTFAGNARLKAKAYARATGRVTIAEDSGLSVAHLKGLPGVYSARFSDCEIDVTTGAMLGHRSSGRPRDEIDRANNVRLFELMRSVEQPYRAAAFEVALAIAAPDGSILFEASGRSNGWIADEPRGTHGFGYDPLFVGDDTGGSTYAELDPARKNLRSHRRRVLEELALWLGRTLKMRDENLIVVDGNDGTGKTTLLKQLEAHGYRVQDRGIPTKMTDNRASSGMPGEIYLILDATVEASRARLAKAGRDLNERYHTIEDLTLYRERFLSVQRALPNSFLVDASGDEMQTFGHALQVLMR